MRFTGNNDAKTDQKGRVFLPAAFRKVLVAEGVDGLILRRDVFQKCLVLYPQSVWDEMVDSIVARTNRFDRRGMEVLRVFVHEAESVSLDGDGRILIPKRYLQAVDIKQEVRFIGVNDTIEIWDRQAADELKNNHDAFADNLEALMKPAGA